MANATETPAGGAAIGAPAVILRAEGLAVFGVGVIAYSALGASWWLFGALILAPDLSMAGYLAGPRWGALLYNAVHSYVGPAMLGAAAYALGSSLAGALALIWATHIGLDRALGYGLKYTAGFAFTHLGRIGRS
ncbi:DUF4260 domain-containing protein [Ancylobacter dichloromethanicus]|uniref:DUF4260 domain-containing protein n=1 Tax=Ancylobacter dichloromethanicus TaxID=518825 RepID=A0A9W6MXV0_9HYPH|nr:DUF4260 domain-containing protein [Ancylobacter dichloromethanicus]MBS7555272.1 DUF4260 domain-containing protein [Ancylobacter dichloromethanicus]GLK70453.1 hypothetical protein GCM10017643_05680 [Ancylobacter dichloromethanicus]